MRSDATPRSQPSNRAPVADAGEDFEVELGAAVTLDGSGSADPNGDALTYAWSQEAGEAVELQGADTARSSFEAPGMPGARVFRLRVNDGRASDTDTVTVRTRTVHVALFMSASDSLGRQGFVRVVNHSGEAREVSIVVTPDAPMVPFSPAPAFA